MIDNEFEKQIDEYIKLGKTKDEIFEVLKDGSFRDVFLTKELSLVAGHTERSKVRVLHNAFAAQVCLLIPWTIFSDYIDGISYFPQRYLVADVIALILMFSILAWKKWSISFYRIIFFTFPLLAIDMGYIYSTNNEHLWAVVLSGVLVSSAIVSRMLAQLIYRRRLLASAIKDNVSGLYKF